MKCFCWLPAELDPRQAVRAKDQPLSRALPCANPLDFHAEIQVRVNAALSSLNFGWGCSLAATAQPCQESHSWGSAGWGAQPSRAGQGGVRGAPGCPFLGDAPLEVALAGQCSVSSRKVLGNSVSWSLQSFLAPAVWFSRKGDKLNHPMVWFAVFLKIKVFKIMPTVSNVTPPWGNMRQEPKMCCHNVHYLRISLH